MLQEIPKLDDPSPHVSKAAALHIIQHVTQNKGELPYLIKRLVNGLESVRVSTRTGCYTTLTLLLTLQKVDPLELFDLMQKALVTNKQSTKRERRLIYTARILCTGAILRTTPASTLAANTEFIQPALRDLVDLSLKKSTYFLLALPFLTHFFTDPTITQELFDALSDTLRPLVAADHVDAQEEEEEAESGAGDDDAAAASYVCRAQLALVCRRFTKELQLNVDRVCKSMLSAQVQFPEELLGHLFAHLKGQSSEDVSSFFKTLLSSIKPTQFNLLCVCVEKCVAAGIPLHWFLSRELVQSLVGVFKVHDPEFTAKAKGTLHLMLQHWTSIPKKKKKALRSALQSLFGGNDAPPSLLHEYKVLHPVIRGFVMKLPGEELEMLFEVVRGNLDQRCSVRMALVYLQFIGTIGQGRLVPSSTLFSISCCLMDVGLGRLGIHIKEEQREGEEGQVEQQQALVRRAAVDSLKSLLSRNYRSEFMDLLGERVAGEYKQLCGDNQELCKLVKQVKKTSKSVDPHLKYLLWSYVVRGVIGDQGVVGSSTLDNIRRLIEESQEEGNAVVGVVRFLLDCVLREDCAALDYEEMFKKLILEGKVGEEVVQVLSEAIDTGEGEEEQDSEEDSDDDDDDEGAPVPKMKRLDPEVLARLRESVGGGGDSEDEESIDLEDATEEDLKQMDGALAKVFAVKRSVKDERKVEDRRTMRVLRLIEAYVSRSAKCMSVGALLLLLMPTVHLLRRTLVGRKSNSQLTTRVIAVLDGLNRVKRFSGCDDVVEGTFASIVEELGELGRGKRVRVVRELMEHAMLVVCKCYLGREKRGKKEGRRIAAVVVGGGGGRVRKRKQGKKKKQERVVMPRFVRLAVELFEQGGWAEGKRMVLEGINGGASADIS